jgi:hypothetical protein
MTAFRAFSGGRLAPALILVLLACGGPDGGRQDVAVEAGAWSLAPERMAAWLARVPGGRPTERDAAFAALVWTDYTLLGHAVASGNPLTDSATAAAVLRPDRILLAVNQWHEAEVARRPRVPVARADSLFGSDSVRVFQHVFFRIDNPQDPAEVTRARQRADSTLADARRGVPFEDLARTRSEDPTAPNGGWLPPARRGELAPEFERAAWPLPPGQVGGVATRFGLHIVRRPPAEEARGRILAQLEAAATEDADRRQADSLLAARGFAPADGAVPSLRRFFADPATRTRPDTLARWTEGALLLEDAAFWIDLLPPRGYLDLRGASDNALQAYVRDLSVQGLLAEQARAAGVTLTPTQWRALYDGYLRALRESLALLGLNDPGATLAAGEVPGRVAALLEALSADRLQFRPLPSALGSLLRSRYGYRLHPGGLEDAARLGAERARDSVRP